MQVLPPALAPLAAYKQFILYRLTPDGAKTKKQPVDPRTLMVADAHNPDAWLSFEDAALLLPAVGKNHGIGFVFTANDPFWFLDIDGAWDGTAWSQTAIDACNELAGCAIEVSQSQRGLHIFGTGDLPPHGNRNKDLHTEFYSDKRFVALTGNGTQGSASFAPAGLSAYVTKHFPVAAGAANSVDGEWWSEAPVAAWRGPTDDQTLIDRAMKSRSAANVFGGKACFADLWTADPDALGKQFPPDRAGDSYNASSADAALAQHLCFWTGNDAARIERLMRMSDLMRDKWDDRGDYYLPRTIRKACSMQVEFLADAPPSASPFADAVRGAPVLTAATPITEDTWLKPVDQVAYFAGCTYVVDADRFALPNGQLVDATRFNRIFGGRTFIMDNANGKTSRKAAEAFCESQAYRFPRVDTVCFRPRSDPGAILFEGGRSLVNTWVPVEVSRAQGDTSRFWDHMAKMFPNERDRMTLVCYMAACVQMQGTKFQWAPLVQGTTGNGKSMLSQFVRKAIGKQYCHTPRAKNIDNDFNAWMFGRTFCSVDEIYIPDKRLNILETLKEMITSDEQEVTKKGIDSLTLDICCNFMFFTNHLDGIRKNRHERRIAPFFTAQQTPSDLQASGMSEGYFMDFVDWLKGVGKYQGEAHGYAIIAEMLWTMDIPAEFDPSKHPRAPHTSSTEAAIVASRGPVEQEIIEAVETSQPGFRGGWVSSLMLKRMVESSGHRVPLAMQTELLVGLGYQPHPALKDGRVNNEVAPDAGKPRLFVRSDQLQLLAIDNGGEAARSYVQAQLGK